MKSTCCAALNGPNETVFGQVAGALWRHARIGVNLGKTKLWNRAGVEPEGFQQMGSADDPAWVGDARRAPDKQGLVVLGGATWQRSLRGGACEQNQKRTRPLA